jgi:hypothetical protein
MTGEMTGLKRVCWTLQGSKSREQFLGKIEQILSPLAPAKRWGENIFSITVRHLLLVCVIKDDGSAEMILASPKQSISLSLAKGDNLYARFSAIIDHLKSRAIFVSADEIRKDIDNFTH